MLDDGSSDTISSTDKMTLLCRLVAEHDVIVVVVACIE